MSMPVKHITDTLVCDSTRLHQFINSGNYDYNSELDATKRPSVLGNMLDSFMNWLDKIMNDIFNGFYQIMSSSKIWVYVFIAIVAILLLTLLYVMYKKKMFFFRKRRKVEQEYEVIEDNIYGIEFEEEIELALSSGNYKEAIRLRYLQCLRILSDNNAIAWMAFKTPLQYTQEFVNDQFKELTSRYILVRYGDYEATQHIFEIISQLKNEIEQFLITKNAATMPLTETMEGGEQ